MADIAGSVRLEVETAEGARVRRASGEITTRVHETVTLTLDLSLPLTCTDGQKTGDEVAIDCGGNCPACDVGTPCRTDADCLTRACAAQGICSFASGPPNWVDGASLVPARAQLSGTSTPQGVVALGGVNETGAELSLVQRLGAGTSLARARSRCSSMAGGSSPRP